MGAGGGVKFSTILRGVAHKGRGGGSDRFRIFFFFLGGGGSWQGGGGLSKKGSGQYFRVGLTPWRTLCKMTLDCLILKSV